MTAASLLPEPESPFVATAHPLLPGPGAPIYRCCALIPTYDNPRTLRRVVERVRQHLLDVVVIDDGSGPEAQAVCRALANEGLAHVIRHEKNGGKGAAVKSGLRWASEHEFTHALQIDADGQHDVGRIPFFVERSRRQPEAAVLAYPEYDESAPRLRRVARRFTQFWVNLEAGKGLIRDPMIGLRVYPLATVTELRVAGNRMDFDVEITVRLAWAGVPIVNLPVHVRYLTASEGGVSHFQPWMDNVRFAWLHSKLCTLKGWSWCWRGLRRLLRPVTGG